MTVVKIYRYRWILALALCGACAPGLERGNAINQPAVDPCTSQVPPVVSPFPPGTPVPTLFALDTNVTTQPVGPLFVGRIDTTNPNTLIFGWPGSGAVLRFTGTAVQVKLHALDPSNPMHSTYVAQVDNGPLIQILMQSGMDLYTISTGLTQGDHVVELFKANEGYDGYELFEGFTGPAPFTMLPPPNPRARHVEVIGASTSMGFGVKAINNSGNVYGQTVTCAQDDLSYMLHDVTQAYTWRVGESTQSEVRVLAISGKGLTRNLSPGTDPTLMPAIVMQSQQPTGSPAWDHTRWQADAVFIDLGRNDFDSSGGVDDAAYTQGWISFLHALRGFYPNAWLIPVVSQRVDGDMAARSNIDLDQAIAQVADTKVQKLDFLYDDGSRGYACALHPTPATHMLLAQQIEDLLHQNSVGRQPFKGRPVLPTHTKLKTTSRG